jgi:hypothetical protein
MFNTYAFADKAGPILFEKAEPPLGSNTLTSSPVHKLAPLPYPGAAGGGAGPQRRAERKNLLQGDIPSPIEPPPGCTFHTRRLYAEVR